MALHGATKAQIQAARSWVEDCVWREDPDVVADYDDDTIIRGVDAHYSGGWDQFLIDALFK